jgi:hypothetical protein
MVLLALGGEIEVSVWLGCGEVARPAKFTGGTVAAMFYPLVETEVWFFSVCGSICQIIAG